MPDSEDAEDLKSNEEAMETSASEEDQAEIDAKNRLLKIKQGLLTQSHSQFPFNLQAYFKKLFFEDEEDMKKRSRAVQRNLPRPIDMNHSILRPIDLAQPLTDLQNAEELVKKEMLVMLHFDTLYTPTASQCGLNNKKQMSFIPQPLNYEKHKSYLSENKYENFSVEEMSHVIAADPIGFL